MYTVRTVVKMKVPKCLVANTFNDYAPLRNDANKSVQEERSEREEW
jgi:hypothetical protein